MVWSFFGPHESPERAMSLESCVMGERNSYILLDKLRCSSLWKLPLRNVVVALSWILELFKNSDVSVRV